MKKKIRAGRPTETSREEKKAHLIREARKELLRTGGARFSLNRVLEAAGGSKTTLYSYFGSRDGLLEAVLSAVVADGFRPGDLPKGSPREQLLAIARGTHQAVLSPEALALYRMAITEAPKNRNLGKVFHATGPAEARRILSALLTDLTRSKQVRVKDPRLAADFFFGMLLEAPLLSRMLALGEKEDLDKVAAEAVEVFLRAYAAE